MSRPAFAPMTTDELHALPAAVDLATAGRALGIGRSKAHEMARAGEFPCPVLRLGHRYRVRMVDLFRVLGLQLPEAAAGQGGSPPVQESPAPTADDRAALRASLDEIIRCAAAIIARAEQLRAGDGCG